MQARADRRRAVQQAPQQAGAKVLDHQQDQALVESEVARGEPAPVHGVVEAAGARGTVAGNCALLGVLGDFA